MVGLAAVDSGAVECSFASVASCSQALPASSRLVPKAYVAHAGIWCRGPTGITSQQ